VAHVALSSLCLICMSYGNCEVSAD